MPPPDDDDDAALIKADVRAHYILPPPCVPRMSNELAWVRTRIDTSDPRFSKPVPRYNIIMDQPEPKSMTALMAQLDARPKQTHVERRPYVSGQSDTRSGQWSTLRAMLEFRGNPVRRCQASWGAGGSQAPPLTTEAQTFYPQIRSEITKFVDEACRRDPYFNYF